MKKVKCYIAIAILVIVILSNVTNVSALKLGGKLIKGPRNMTYTVNGGATAYTNNINGAAYNWMYTGYDNPIYMTPVSSLNGSVVDFYSYYITYPEELLAGTIFFDEQSVEMNTTDRYRTEDWLYAEIHLNDVYKDDYSINHYVVVAHEIGHALGLDENPNRYSIMCQFHDWVAVDKPQYIDSEEVVEIYGRY